jgi:hypothetical protein
MSSWQTVYHQALLVRLLSLALIFGVIAPGVWLLLRTGFGLVRHCQQRLGHASRPRHGHAS